MVTAVTNTWSISDMQAYEQDVREYRGKTNGEKLNSEDNLRDNLGLNSFDLAELTVKIEDEFDIDIFEDGLVNTIGEIYEKLA